MANADLTCREVADFLSDYLEHALSAEQRGAFETHLHECDDCVLYLRSYEDTIRLSRAAYRDADAPAAAAGVPERLVRAILAARRR